MSFWMWLLLFIVKYFKSISIPEYAVFIGAIVVEIAVEFVVEDVFVPVCFESLFYIYYIISGYAN